MYSSSFRPPNSSVPFDHARLEAPEDAMHVASLNVEPPVASVSSYVRRLGANETESPADSSMDGSRTLSMQDLPPELQPYMFPETLYRVLPKILHSALSALGERGESSFDAEEDDVRGVFYFSSLEPQRVKRHVSREIADLRARIGRRDCFVLLSSDCRRFRDGVPFVWTQWRCQDISSDYSVDFCLTFVAFSTHDDDPLQEEVPIPDDLRPFSKAETLLPSLPKFLSDFADSI